ncbi:putative Ig domain-containing protein [Luminiphilus sp.]|nr:putative Ig domain-containing protein [Luminiphilus sp.]
MFFTKPTITGTPGTSLNQNSSYTFMPEAADVDGDTLTFGITNKPSWASLNTETGELSGTPTAFDVGIYSNVVISASDGVNTAELAAFSITVIDLPDPPTIGGTPVTTVAQDQAYTFTPTASDPDSGDTLTFSIVNQPSWASFDTATGTLSGAPGNDNVGVTSAIVISVSDGTASASLPAFDLVVTNVNDPPTIGGTPVTTVAQDQAYTFTPTASDPDSGDTLTFSIVNQPSWASFDTATGTLSGAPGNDNVGVTSAIVISVSDGEFTADLDSFTLSVLHSLCGFVIDGPVAETRVYLDSNGNGIFDDGEDFTFTDSDGYYTYNPDRDINYCIEGPPRHCLTSSSNIYSVVVRIEGGYDQLTGDPFLGQMSRRTEPARSTEQGMWPTPVVITPLTTLVAQNRILGEDGESYGSGLYDILNALGDLGDYLETSLPPQTDPSATSCMQNWDSEIDWHNQPVSSALVALNVGLGNSTLADACASNVGETACRTETVSNSILDRMTNIHEPLCTSLGDTVCENNTNTASGLKRLRNLKSARSSVAQAPDLTGLMLSLVSPVNLRAVLSNITEDLPARPDADKLDAISNAVSLLASVLLSEELTDHPQALVDVIRATSDFSGSIDKLLNDSGDKQSAIDTFKDEMSAENLFKNIPINGNEPNQDNDTLIDILDPDDDNDGIADAYDTFPNDPEETNDTDGDGIGDNADSLPDLSNYGNDGTATIEINPVGAAGSCELVDFTTNSIDRSNPGVAEGGVGFAAEFSMASCSTNTPERVRVSIDFGVTLSRGSRAFKILDNGDWREMTDADITGNVVSYSLTDNGIYDLNKIAGEIRDPVTVAVPVKVPAIPIPIMSVFGVLALCLIAGLVGVRNLREKRER